MVTAAPLSLRGFKAGLLALALLLGLLAGVNPLLAILLALGLIFVVITFVSLTAGVCLFAVLSFLDTVAPSAGPLSVSKLLGLLLAGSWLAQIATESPDRRRELLLHPALIYLLVVFLGWVAMSAAWADAPEAIPELLLRYGPNAMLFLIVFAAVRTREQAMWVCGAFVLGALISAAYGLVVPTDANAEGRLSGALGNANETAAALVAGAALALALVGALRDQPLLRLAAVIVVPLCTYGILLTLSRGGLVALVAALVATIVIAGRWRGRAIVVALITLTGAFLYFSAFASDEARERVTTIQGGTGRVDVWRVAWRMVEDQPLLGVGAGNFQTSAIQYVVRPGVIQRDDFLVDAPKTTHNTYLQILAELGVVGLALFLAIIIYSLASVARAASIFSRLGDREMDLLSRALFVALVGLLASAFFGSRQFSKQLWLLLALAPAFLALARAGAVQARERLSRAAFE